METRGQELRKIEETMKNLLKEQTEKQDRAIQDIMERQSRDMEEVRSMLHKLESVISSQSSSSGSSIMKSGRDNRNPRLIQPKLTRLKFPKFYGKGLSEWLFKCEQYFEFDDTAEDSKVKIAALHLDGKALQWHQNFMKNGLHKRMPSWDEYTHEMSVRFGADLHYDPMAELMNLKQNGTVQTYLDKFDEILNRVHLSEEYTVSCFLSGLKEEIQYPVRMFAPSNLQQAISLAKLQELAVENMIGRAKE